MRAAIVSLSLIALLASCRRDRERITAAPERNRNYDAATTAIVLVDALIGHAGEDVTIEGTVVSGKAQHMTQTMVGKEIAYVELAGSKTEIVAYLPTLPACAGSSFLSGRVIVVTGKAKGPSGGGDYAETQLDVQSWTCRP